MTTLPEALTLAGYSFPVIPIKPRGKTPICAHGCKDGTTDIDQIEIWFSGNNHNIAVCTGKDLLILDIDGEEGLQTLRNLEATHGKLPETPEVTTGGGGTHYYFKPPYELPSSIAKLGPGVDIRCRGGYAVAPPSVNHTGNAYEWAITPEDCPLADLPEWIVTALAPRPSEPAKSPIQPEQFERIFHYYIEKAYNTLESGKPRHNTLFELALQLRDNGTPRDWCEEVLLDFAAKYRHSKRGEFPDAEAVKIVKDVYSTEPRSPSPLEVTKAPEVVLPAGGWQPLDLWECMQPPPPTDWLVHNIIAAGDLIMVSAPAGCHKTNLFLDMAICIASDKPWLLPLPSDNHTRPWVTYKAPTLFYGTDTPKITIKNRVGSMIHGHNADGNAPFYAFAFPDPPLNACQSLELLEEQIVRFGCKLAVIDNLTTVTLGADRNDGNVAGGVLTRFRALSQKTDCAIVIIHHDNKTGGYSGSHTLRDLVDFTYTVRKEGDSVIMSADKVRTSAPPSIGAKFVYEQHNGDSRVLASCQMRGVPVVSSKDLEIREAILDLIQGDDSGVGLTASALGKAITGKNSAISAQRDILVEQGLLTKIIDGKKVRFIDSQGVKN